MEELMIAVCEDDPADRVRLRALIGQGCVPARVDEFDCGEAFLSAWRPERYDLIFMDIFLAGIDGVETVRRVREQDGGVLVAFTTVSKDFALESYRLDVKRYIEKEDPGAAGLVDEMLALARDRRIERGQDVVLFGHRAPLRVPATRLRYAEQQRHKLVFHFAGGEDVERTGKIDELEPLLAEYPFFRCHTSYLVNLAYVQGMDREQMVFRMREGGSAYIRREDFYGARRQWENWLFTAARRKGDG